jgi:hypothetical protein
VFYGFFLDKIMSRRSNSLLKTSKGNSTTTNKSQRDPPKVAWEHSWPLNETKDALTQSPFQALPTEVMLHIFKFLNIYDLGNVSLVCRSFKMIADQDEIWKLKSNCKFIHSFVVSSFFLLNLFVIASTKLNSKSFKEIYMDWMYEKYLRNLELEQVEAEYREQSSHYACGMRCGPPRYPMRPEGKHKFVSMGGFKQHPNESQDM